MSGQTGPSIFFFGSGRVWFGFPRFGRVVLGWVLKTLTKLGPGWVGFRKNLGPHTSIWRSALSLGSIQNLRTHTRNVFLLFFQLCSHTTDLVIKLKSARGKQQERMVGQTSIILLLPRHRFTNLSFL